MTQWWDRAVGYSVYIRSFRDTDGDGLGDLNGITSKLDYLADLGVGIIWISPFYESPMADGGYDVRDHCAVDPRFGTLADFARLVHAAHDRGIRVVVDFVANHTSDEHPWFLDALAGRDALMRDRYIWRDPAPDGGPPNNWVSYFGGPAWTFDEKSGQYYLHLFLPQQPDLNWRNPMVGVELERTMEFWLDNGADGFRIDVAQGLLKDEQLRSNPQVAPWDPSAPRLEQWAAFDHRYDIGQPESHAIFARWRRICASRGAVLIGEVSVPSPGRFAQLVAGSGLDLGMWLGLLHVEWEPASLRSALREPLEELRGSSAISWLTSSLDEPRAATRFGDGDTGRERALALATLAFCLPGVPFLFQGEELGLVNGAVIGGRRADPVGADATQSRDGSRTVMPWDSGPNFGYSRSRPWLPDTGRHTSDTAAAQRGIAGSWFERYRQLATLRRTIPELSAQRVEWLDRADDGLIAFRRGRVHVTANAAAHALEIELRGDVLFTTHASVGRTDGIVSLHPAQAIVTREPVC